MKVKILLKTVLFFHSFSHSTSHHHQGLSFVGFMNVVSVCSVVQLVGSSKKKAYIVNLIKSKSGTVLK